jgi:alpha-beta hydrolase superfamily lysophospholipase
MSVVSSTKQVRSGAQRAALVAGVGGAVAVGFTVGGSVAGATLFARRVLTPDARRPDDTEVIRLDGDEVTLGLTAETTVPGWYGLWLDGGAGHARVGDVLGRDDEARTVVRRVLSVDRGVLAPGPARWNSYFYWDSPALSLDVPTRDVAVEGELGPMPAWLVEPEVATGRWAVLVHGRGARREECLRAVPTLRRLGYTTLVISYRNDLGAPPAPDGRYNLGLSEWRDVESAMLYAVQHGAEGLVLGGWSMGGAIILQTLNRSWVSDLVEAVVLDAPVVDWGDVLAHHARIRGVPAPLGWMGSLLMGRRAGRRLVGVHDPVDVARTNWVARAEEIRHPILIQHSVDDEFVPVGPSVALAQARPDRVTLEPWDTTRHCKEWNLDPERWERVLADFLVATHRGGPAARGTAYRRGMACCHPPGTRAVGQDDRHVSPPVGEGLEAQGQAIDL